MKKCNFPEFPTVIQIYYSMHFSEKKTHAHTSCSFYVKSVGKFCLN